MIMSIILVKYNNECITQIGTLLMPQTLIIEIVWFYDSFDSTVFEYRTKMRRTLPSQQNKWIYLMSPNNNKR